jgi:hypothetical protein
METLEIMKQRHSVRQYTNKKIEKEKREALDALTARINEKTGLHIQIFYDEPKCFNSMISHYGSFKGVNNYIALVGKKSADLDEKLGFFGEQIVLKAQELGLNTCWVALTHGKSSAQIDNGEKQVCLIALGYGVTSGTAHKSKSVSQVSNYRQGMPEWFLQGVEAALLAPTAVNQQKFYFEFFQDCSVKATSGRGFYTKLDLGIAEYHFEAVTGKTVK